MNFSEWLLANSDKIVKARECSIEQVGSDPGTVSNQLERSRRHYVIICQLKADATTWVNRLYLKALEFARDVHSDWPERERRAYAEADIMYLEAWKIQQDLTATVRALDKMHFEILNDRRTSFPSSKEIGT